MTAPASVPASRFMLLFRNAGPDTHEHLTPDKRVTLAQQWNDWVARLTEQGRMRHGHPLGLDGCVVSGRDGGRVTDGPYAETTEVVGGYICVSATDLAEAAEIAKGCPGLPLGLTVEVRPLADASPVLDAVSAVPAS